jgi:hypothetical protein
MNHSNKFVTPIYIDDAIKNAICIGQMNEVTEKLYNDIRNFLAQKFCVAMLETKGETEALLLQNLFDEITRRQL